MLEIRELSKEDVEEVEKIYDLYWNDEFRNKLSEKLRAYVEKTPEAVEKGYRYFVAVENGEVVGVSNFRRAPKEMRLYTTTENPVEFYALAVKYKGRGIGHALRINSVNEAKKLGYTEGVFFSALDHKDSWNFHDNSGFERAGEFIAPNGAPGIIWRKVF